MSNGGDSRQVLWNTVEKMTSPVENLGTLRRQMADLSSEFSDYGVVMAIDREMNGQWLPPVVRYKYAKFFTHWAVLAISRLADPNSESTSVPALIKLLRELHQECEMKRDRWVAHQVETAEWRTEKEKEDRVHLEKLVAQKGKPIWIQPGRGERGTRLSETWNKLTGREQGRDNYNDEMEDWIFESAKCPLKSPAVITIRKWRNKNIGHQDIRQTLAGRSGYDVMPLRPLVRAYWAVAKGTHRALLLAKGEGLHGLTPISQFNVTKEFEGEKLETHQIDAIESRRLYHTEKWERSLRSMEDQWYRKLREIRQDNDKRKRNSE